MAQGSVSVLAGSDRLLCRSDELLERGAGFKFDVSWHGETVPAFVVRYNGKAHAYLNRCAHVPVPLDWDGERFFDHSRLYLLCATHGALYAPDSGHCLGGRCNGRHLTALDVVERDGAIYLISRHA